MKTWDDWSDREIDSSVATIVFDCIGWSKSKSKNVLYIECTVSKEIKVQTVPNYCNSWADIGPIIQRKQIDIISPTAGGMSVWQAEKFYPEKLSGNINASAKNPLRAAAIVFLMMNGVNPE